MENKSVYPGPSAETLDTGKFSTIGSKKNDSKVELDGNQPDRLMPGGPGSPISK